MEIIDGRKLSRGILDDVKHDVAALSFTPVFCDVLVGDDPASVQYVRMKAKVAESVGIKFHAANFPESINTEELIKEIKLLNRVEHMSGIIVQLPLPPHLDQEVVLNAIDPSLDVDCLGSVTSGEFYDGKSALSFPTALACLFVLDSLKLDLQSKSIVVLGQGKLVGKPVTAMLRVRGLAPTVITPETENPVEVLRTADVIISGIGEGKYIKGDMIKSGAVLIDAGASESNGSIVGDVDLESVQDVAGFVSPVPGGVGPVTVAMLLRNVLQVAKSKVGKI